ncbi:hypothetical protein PG357_10185 [Riemerella anatipestifer]|nr:hypothetical protein [Riemerella anatipestifer]
MTKFKYIILLGGALFLSPIFAQGAGFDVGTPVGPDVPPDDVGVGFDTGVPATPIDLYSTELVLLAIGFILIISYYLRKKQLKSL